MSIAECKMTPIRLLQIVSEHLRVAYPKAYAVAGGLAASFYRKQPRMTNDVDIAFCIGNAAESKESAKKIINCLGFKPAMGWIPSQDKMSDPVALVIGRANMDELSSTIDLLLPVFPWVKQSILRAQDNFIDYGFALLPTVTPEDIIIAKVFALSIEENRFTDLDDIRSILAADNHLDMLYLVQELERLSIGFPKVLRPELPKILKRISSPKTE